MRFASQTNPFGLSLSKPPAHAYLRDPLRHTLVRAVLEWERVYGVAPQGVTGALAEFDAAMLVGHTPETYSIETQGATAVRKGYDFIHHNIRYQVKGSRPSGKPGSFVTRAGKPSNFDWDICVWVLYNQHFHVMECWACDLEVFRSKLDRPQRLSPKDWQVGKRLA